MKRVTLDRTPVDHAARDLDQVALCGLNPFPDRWSVAAVDSDKAMCIACARKTKRK